MNDYLVIGTQEETAEEFREEITAANSHDAYLTVTNKTGCIRVIAIKIRCVECLDFHMSIPKELYI